MARAPTLLGVALCISLCLLASSFASPTVGGMGRDTRGEESKPQGAPRPNIVFVLLDDGDELLGSMDYMPLTREHLAYEGVRARRSIATTSLCGPARTSILSGMYTHNHQIYTNNLPKGGFHKIIATGLESKFIFPALKARGYRTALTGKYMNDYREVNTSHVPPGIDDALIVTSDDEDAWNITKYSNNGRPYDGAGQYQTDTIFNRALAFLRNHLYRDTPKPHVPAGPAFFETHDGPDVDDELRKNPDPFFLYVAPEAPHTPADPAPRHANLFPNLKDPRPGNWNSSATEMSLQPSQLKNLPPLSQSVANDFDVRYRKRVLSLQAVDEGIDKIVQFLKAAGVLDNTWIFFTSDNGFHFGQKRATNGKRQIFVEDVLVPFYVRGPGVPHHGVTDVPVLNIDIAPTFLDIAGGASKYWYDGLSLVEVFRQATRPRHREHGDRLEDYKHPNRLILGDDIAGPGANRGQLANDAYEDIGDFDDDYEGELGGKGTNGAGQSSKVGPIDGREGSPPVRRRTLLFANHTGGGGIGSNNWQGIWTFPTADDPQNNVFAVWPDTGDCKKLQCECEYYNLRNDPWQTINLCGFLPAAKRAQLTATLEEYVGCAGASCRALG